MKLNDRACKHADPHDPPSRAPKKYADGYGLSLWVMPDSKKYWRYKYRMAGKEKLLALGVYPETSLAEAREKHRVARKLVAEGIDPAKDRQKKKRDIEKDNNNTFEVVAREWHAHKTPDWKEEHAQTILRRLEHDVFPCIGDVPMKEIEHVMLLDMAKKIRERGANELSKRVIQMSKHIFGYAIVTGRADKNIADDLRGMIKPPPKGHYAALEAKDLPEFLSILNSNKARLHAQTKLAVELLMLTFVRTGEMIKAEWNEFDLDEKMWLIPAHRMKMKKEHLVPLSRQAIEILTELRALHTHPRYVFPSRISRDNHMSNNTILKALERMGYKGKMTGHGFRALAMSTIMEKLNYPRDVVDVQLAHAKRGDVAKAYDRAKYKDQRVLMMQDWSDYLERVALGGKVIPAKFGVA